MSNKVEGALYLGSNHLQGTLQPGGFTGVLEHDEAASAVITAELVACTLGARSRPELRLDYQATLDERLRIALERITGPITGSMRDLRLVAERVANQLSSKLPAQG